MRKGSWVVNRVETCQPSFGKVKDVHTIGDETLVDVILYSPNGECIGRESPVLGGPVGFEPCIPSSQLTEVEEPRFPLARDLRNGCYGGSFTPKREE